MNTRREGVMLNYQVGAVDTPCRVVEDEEKWFLEDAEFETQLVETFYTYLTCETDLVLAGL